MQEGSSAVGFPKIGKRRHAAIDQQAVGIDGFVSLRIPHHDDIGRDGVVAAERRRQLRVVLRRPVQRHQMGVLLIAGNLQTVAARNLMDIPLPRTQMPQPQERLFHEARADRFELVAGGLTRDPLAARLRFEQIGDAFGYELACAVAAVRVADHAVGVDGQRGFKQLGVESLAGGCELNGHRHQATLNMRLAAMAAWMRPATAAATGGGNALPIWR